MRFPTAGSASSEAARAPRPPPDLEAFACGWERDLSRAGLQLPQLSTTFAVGVPALALAMIGAVALAAFLAPDPGRGAGLPGLGILAVAAAPWVHWLVHGDDGPTWSFVFVALAPLAALGIGQWFVDAIGLGSGLAYLLVALPVLLLVVLVVAFAPTWMAVGAAVVAYAAFGGPLLAGWVRGPNEDGTGVVTWNVGFAFCLATGYAVRLSLVVSRKVNEAREAHARQVVADERRQVARDIHDVVAHTLSVTMLHITAARMAVRRSSPGEAEEALEEAERHGRASLADIRSIVRLLRSDDAGGVDAAQPGLADVETLADSYRAAGLAVELSLRVDGQRTSRSPTAELAVYRVLQEALANAARHGSGPATVELAVFDGQMSLNVGNPVRPENVRPSQGSGLLGMRERVSAAGGTVEAGTRDGRWVVRAVVPAAAGA